MRSPFARFRTPVSAVLLMLSSLAGCSSNGTTAAATPFSTACETSVVNVYADAFHTKPQCQFNASSGAVVYVNVGNLAPSDYYFADAITTTGTPPGAVGVICAFVWPLGETVNSCPHRGTAKGGQAPGGSISLSWHLNSSLRRGTYTFSIYDLTAKKAVGQANVSIM